MQSNSNWTSTSHCMYFTSNSSTHHFIKLNCHKYVVGWVDGRGGAGVPGTEKGRRGEGGGWGARRGSGAGKGGSLYLDFNIPTARRLDGPPIPSPPPPFPFFLLSLVRILSNFNIMKPDTSGVYWVNFGVNFHNDNQPNMDYRILTCVYNVILLHVYTHRPRDFCRIITEEMSGRVHSLANNGHPSIWWPCSIVFNFGFESEYSCPAPLSLTSWLGCQKTLASAPVTFSERKRTNVSKQTNLT